MPSIYGIYVKRMLKPTIWLPKQDLNNFNTSGHLGVDWGNLMRSYFYLKRYRKLTAAEKRISFHQE